MSYEVLINADTEKRAGKLANLLLNAGYCVYYAEDGDNKIVAATIPSEDVTEVTYKKVEDDWVPANPNPYGFTEVNISTGKVR